MILREIAQWWGATYRRIFYRLRVRRREWHRADWMEIRLQQLRSEGFLIGHCHCSRCGHSDPKQFIAIFPDTADMLSECRACHYMAASFTPYDDGQ